jgi:hypothetical protein
MITVKRFKEIINSCPDNWTIIFRKWEHISQTPDGPYKGYKGFQNIVGVKIVNIIDRTNEIDGNIIRTIIVKDDIDDDLTGGSNEIIEKTIYFLKDTDCVEFNLQVEETPGHLDLIPLKSIEIMDKGYSDKIMLIGVDEF